MSQWRVQLSTDPCPKSAYASIEPAEFAYVGMLRLAANWETFDVETCRVPTLVHEIAHLLHAELTHLWAGDIHAELGWKRWGVLEPRHRRATELMVDHLTQIFLGFLPWEVWAEELWGPDWKKVGVQNVGRGVK